MKLCNPKPTLVTGEKWLKWRHLVDKIGKSGDSGRNPASLGSALKLIFFCNDTGGHSKSRIHPQEHQRRRRSLVLPSPNVPTRTRIKTRNRVQYGLDPVHTGLTAIVDDTHNYAVNLQVRTRIAYSSTQQIDSRFVRAPFGLCVGIFEIT